MSGRMKTGPGIAVQKEAGIVLLIRHYSDSLELPVTDHLLRLDQEPAAREERVSVTVCVLTNTNAEALKVSGLLPRRGRKAKLIQSDNHFNLYYLAEIRYFIQTVRKYSKSPVITGDLWSRAKTELESRYSQSECLPLCLRLLNTFEQPGEKKYVSDLLEFIRESQPEDFYQSGQGTVTVSAIHKAKGKEFDWVFLLLNQMRTEKDEDRRRLYVGITRARNELYVHYNSSCRDDITAEGLERETDDTEYPAPEEIISRLSHEDVVLDFFQGKQRRMLTYHSVMFLGSAPLAYTMETDRLCVFLKNTGENGWIARSRI